MCTSGARSTVVGTAQLAREQEAIGSERDMALHDESAAWEVHVGVYHGTVRQEPAVATAWACAKELGTVAACFRQGIHPCQTI